MDPKPDLIREDIDETRSALTEKLETLEGQLRETVVSAKESVNGTIENVKDSIRHLSPVYQTTQHPFAMVGGVAAIGFFAGRLLQNRQQRQPEMRWLQGVSPELYVDRPLGDTTERDATAVTNDDEQPTSRRFPRAARRPSGPSLWQRFSQEFDGEIQMVKGMVLRGVLDAASDMVKKSAPHWGNQIDQVKDSVASKLTDAPRYSSNESDPNGQQRRGRGF